MKCATSSPKVNIDIEKGSNFKFERLQIAPGLAGRWCFSGSGRRYYWAHEYQVIIQIALSAEGYRAGSWRDVPFRERKSEWMCDGKEKKLWLNNVRSLGLVLTKSPPACWLKLYTRAITYENHSLQLNAKKKEMCIGPLINISLSDVNKPVSPISITITGR